ncbi:MAG: C39 family peptidase [Gammaproteobacteria bacterium]|nr:C39 family peptidase [Gammaproteobacteria bacterium]
MFDIVEPETTEFNVDHYTKLADNGRYLDAQTYCLKRWGPIAGWQQLHQRKIAMRLLANLGRDRDADAILLRSWRSFQYDADLCLKMVFYKLNRFGPIVAQRFYQHHLPLLQQLENASTDLALTQICFYTEQKDFVAANQLLEQIRPLAKDYSWFNRIALNLLQEQQLYAEAAELTNRLLQLYLSDHMLLACCRALLRAQRGDAAKTLLQRHAPNYQSCRLWSELMRLSSRSMDWQLCRKAVTQFQQLQLQPDRTDADLLAICKAKIALSRGDYLTARDMLSTSYCSYNVMLRNNLLAYEPVAQPIKLLPVPHVRQHHLTCAPATLAALSAYFGQHVSQEDIAAEICFDGTPDTLERQWLRQHGYAFIELELNSAELCYQLIDAELPFALVTTYGMSAHLQAVVGYNKALGTAYLMDPSCDTTTEMLLTQTLADESASGPRAMVFVPQTQRDRLTHFANNSTVLYQLYDQVESCRKANAITDARQHLASMQQYDAQHRLTLIANRSMAIEQNDELLINSLTDQLLQQYPDHVGWRLSRFQSLKNLGQIDYAITYLMQQVKSKPHIDLKIRLFSEIYRLQQHRHYCQLLLRDLEISGSYRAEVYGLLADYYWQEQDYIKSCHYYFVACCLDDTHEDYVESYFKAARFLKQTDHAMQRLQQRFEKYGARAASPAISLYRAYDWQGKAQQGLKILEQAREKRPDDIDLVSFSLTTLLHHGQVDQFDLLLKQQRKLLTEAQFYYWQAQRLEWQGELAQAAENYRHCFELSPLLSRFAEPYFSSLRRSNNKELLCDVLEHLKLQYSSHPQLMYYFADWHPDPDIASTALGELAAMYPHNTWLQRRWINHLLKLQKLDEAERNCIDLIQRLPLQSENKLLLARILQAKQLPDVAKAHVMDVLEQQIDHDDAIRMLFELSTSLIDKQNSLQWLLDAMLTQTHYGDAFLDVVYYAERFFSEKHKQQFIQQVLQQNLHVWSARLAWATLLQQNDYTGALKQLQLAIAEFPLLPRNHLALAELYQKMREFELARVCYHQAISLNPAWSYASKQFALFLEQQGDADMEIKVISDTLKHNPDDAYLHGFLADAYFRQNATIKAIEHLQLAVRFEHSYTWAWQRLQQIATDADKPELTWQLAESLHQQFPHSVGVIQALAQLSTNPATKRDYWLQALQLAPADSRIHIDLLQYYLERGNYAELFEHIEHYFVAANRPFEISSILAKAWEYIGKPGEAVDILSASVQLHTPPLRYWQHLIDLQQQLQNNSAAAKTALELIQRLPNDAMAQCVAAEYLLNIDSNKYQKQIDVALQLAYQLEPTNQYIVLTLADQLLLKRQNADCLNLIEQLHLQHRDIWTINRQLKALLRLDNVAPALQLWQEVIVSKEEHFWLYNNTLQYAEQHSSLLLQELTNNLTNAANLAGYTLAKWLTPKQPKKVLQLLQSTEACPAWDGMYEYYLEQQETEHKLPSATLVDPFMARIAANPELAGRLAFLFRAHTRLYQAAELYHSIDATQRPCYVSYHYAITLMDLRRWDDALSVLQLGANSTPDNCFHNLQLWLLGCSFCLQTTDVSAIRFVNRQQLTETEHIVWELFSLLHDQKQEPMQPTQLKQRLSELKSLAKQVGTDDKINRIGRQCFAQLQQMTETYDWTVRWQLKWLSFWLF